MTFEIARAHRRGFRNVGRSALERGRRASVLSVLHLSLLCLPSLLAPPSVQAQEMGDEPWFGLTLPPAFLPHSVPVLIGDRGPAPAVVPVGEEEFQDLEGERLKRDLETIVDFSRESREEREIGEGMIWGRITGFPSSRRTVEWSVEEFRDAGISDVELQEFDQDADAELWLPLSWEVRLLGSPAFGAGSRDVVLETAMPLAPTEIPEGGLTAPLIYVGKASAAEVEQMDVAGKIAVQHITPQGHMVFERSPAAPRARALMEAGAVAVFNVVDLPGNERVRDLSNCGGPCFNLGGRDGHFLASVLSAAAEAGITEAVRAEIRLETETFSGLSGVNGVAVIPGSELPDQTIVVNAHVDAWFDGAGDNGDGPAVMMGLARHFARPEHHPRRTLVFVASAGHHSPGLHGPRRFVAMNPDLVEDAVLFLNIEHVAQRNISPARSEFEDGYRRWVADAAEVPIVAGITNASPFLERLVRRGVERYGTNFVSEPNPMASGEGGGYRGRGVAVFTAMQAPPLYHTSGEVAEVVSAPGLERMARFLAFFIDEVDGAAGDEINP
ncbi:MAG: M28 family peptidase [Gemmatimonadota bacterium]